MGKRKLVIKFYDNPDTNDEEILLKEKDASILYSGIALDAETIARDFVGYWKKISYNLGGLSEERRMLDIDLHQLVASGINKETDVLRGDERPGFSVRIVNNRFRSVKIYQSILEDSRKVLFSLVFLKCSLGGENFYAPKTALIFLDLVIKELSKEELNIFNIKVAKICDKRLEDYIPSF